LLAVFQEDDDIKVQPLSTFSHGKSGRYSR